MLLQSPCYSSSTTKLRSQNSPRTRTYCTARQCSEAREKLYNISEGSYWIGVQAEGSFIPALEELVQLQILGIAFSESHELARAPHGPMKQQEMDANNTFTVFRKYRKWYRANVEKAKGTF